MGEEIKSIVRMRDILNDRLNHITMINKPMDDFYRGEIRGLQFAISLLGNKLNELIEKYQESMK